MELKEFAYVINCASVLVAPLFAIFGKVLESVTKTEESIKARLNVVFREMVLSPTYETADKGVDLHYNSVVHIRRVGTIKKWYIIIIILWAITILTGIVSLIILIFTNYSNEPDVLKTIVITPTVLFILEIMGSVFIVFSGWYLFALRTKYEKGGK